MPGNTKQLKKDVDQKPAPQYFDPVLDEYGYLYGSNGAARHIIYGADGQPVTTSGNKLAVRATEIETMLTTIEGYIDGLEPAIGTPAADPAANTILARLKTLATLIGEVQAAPTANTLLARLKNLETKVDAIIADGLKLSGSNITDGLMVRNNGKVVVDTIINAVTANAGESTDGVSLGITNETEVWVAINIDKQPWTAYCNRPVYLGGVGSESSLFPKRRSVSTAYPTIYSPCYSFFMGLSEVISSGLAEPTTLAEAKLYNFPYQGAKIMIKNEHATEAATVTVKVIRIWR